MEKARNRPGGSGSSHDIIEPNIGDALSVTWRDGTVHVGTIVQTRETGGRGQPLEYVTLMTHRRDIDDSSP